MLNSAMLKVVRRVAKKHGVPTWGVLTMASACGPSGWRGCVPVTVYQQRKLRWVTPSERESLV